MSLFSRVGRQVQLQVSPHFDNFTLLIMDVQVQLGHVFKTHIHELKSSSINAWKNASGETGTDSDLYHAVVFAFAPLVAHSWGVCRPDLLRFLWAVAGHAARNAYPSLWIAF